MSEKYSRLFTLTENLYAEGSPILIKAGALLNNNETNTLHAQLKLQSITNKAIKSAKVEITVFDSVGRPLDGVITADYLDLAVTRDEFFGTKQLIKVAYATARSYTARVIEVGFVDNTVWSDSSSVWETLPKQRALTDALNDSATVEGFKSTFGANSSLVLCEYKDLWLCTCGEINHKGEAYCSQCHASLESLKTVNEDELKREGIYASACKMAESNDIGTLEKAISEFEKIKGYKDSEERLNACKTKLLNLKKLIKKRSRRIKVVSIAAFGTIILLGLLGYFVIYPFIAFQNGNYGVYINMYNVSEFEVPEGTTSIEYWMFEYCESLTSVTIPDSVTCIGNSAFDGCYNLTSVVIGDSVTSIGDYAFYSCDKLTSVTIPDSVTSIGKGAFAYCSSLTSVTIPDSVTSIGKGAFSDCTSLTSVTIPDSVTYIGSYAFSYCPIENATIPTSAISSISNGKLNDVVITSGDSISDGAFAYCTSLTSVTIPDSVTSIGSNAFYWCTSLKVINYRGSKEQWKAISKGFAWDIGIDSYTVNYNYDGE